MSTNTRSLFNPLTIGTGLTLIALIVAGAAWATHQPTDERPIRTRLSNLGVVTALDSNGRSIGSVNFASIKDKGTFGEAFEIVLGLEAVSSLGLNGMPVNNSDLENISRLSSLITLSLAECKDIGGAGFEPLSALKSLQTLHLSDTQTSDQDIPSLSRLAALKSLDLSRTKVHKDLSALSTLPSLKWVLFNGDSLDEGALVGLSAAPQLSRVTLLEAKYAARDVQALKAACPSLTVDESPGR